MNGLLGIADGIEQVLALRGEEVLTELSFLMLLKCRRVDGSEVFDLRPRLVIRLFGSLQDIGGSVGRGFEVGDGDAEFLAACFIEKL